ncbi:MAG: hypothetical protein ABI150_09650 [Nitrobacter sp.]
MIIGDWKQRREFRAGDVATGRHLHSEILQRLAGAVEERFERDRRMIIKQDDQFFADMNQRDLFARDRREIRLDTSVVAQRHNNRLITVRLGYLDDPRLLLGSAGSRGIRLGNLQRSVHESVL